MLAALSWKKLFTELLLVLLCGWLIGLLTGQIAWSLFAASLLLIFWHCRQLLRLSHWLWVDRKMTPPVGFGSWEPLFYGLHQLYRRNKRRRQELRHLIQRFRSGAESLPDAIILTTNEGNIYWCNQLAQRYLGLRWPQDKDQNIRNLLRYPEFTRFLQQKAVDKPFTQQLNNGTQIEFRLMPYSDNHWLIAARDVTQLLQLEKMRQNFFANVSHELRTPLTVLQGYLELLEHDGLASEERHKALQAMTVQSQRMQNLVSQLLTLARIESATKENFTDLVDVSALLKQLQQEALLLSNQQQQLEFNIEENLQVYGNRSQLYSVFSNLIFNAILHTAPDTRIQVSWKLSRQGAEFSVKDNGIGINYEHLPRLTERFYRVCPARTQQKVGSGLGLAIVKHGLMHYQSRLQITSQPSIETCFSFTLPNSFINSPAKAKESVVT